MSTTTRNDDSIRVTSGATAPHDTASTDVAPAPRRQVGTRAGILAGLTLGALGAAYAMSITTVSAGHVIA